jgi:hypothetical protein
MATLECERREVESRGYLMQEADTLAWLIRADRSRGESSGSITGVEVYDEMTLRVYALPEGRYALRVVVDAYQSTPGDEAVKIAIDPSPQAQRDVREILEACGAPADGT